MAAVWIVHREASARSALARQVGAGDDAIQGTPGDPRFERAGAPDLVILGLEADLEQELEFAHAQSARHPEAAWILLAQPGEADEVARLFDTIPAEVLHFPSEGTLLRRRVRAARTRRRAATLSERRARDAVAARFGRWFADLELPSLLRALDPRLAEVPLLVRGEPGTGRSVLAAYVHVFGGGERGHLARIACSELDAEGLRDEIRRAAAEPAARRGLTLCLEDVELLPPAAQRRLRGWVEAGLPPHVAGPASGIRWVATCSELGPHDPAESLDLGLAQVLAGLEVRIPPLRERLAAVPRLASESAVAWSAARGEAPRRFSAEALEVLSSDLWPGNVRELEAVVVRSLAAGDGEVIGAADLRFDGTWPEAVRALDEGSLAGEAELVVEAEAESFEEEAEAESFEEEPEPVRPRRVAPGSEPDDGQIGPRPGASAPRAATAVGPDDGQIGARRGSAAPPSPPEAVVTASPEDDEVVAAPEAEADEVVAAPEAEADEVVAASEAGADEVVTTPEAEDDEVMVTATPEPDEDAATPEAAADEDAAPLAAALAAAADEPLRRLIGAITHEVRNPLVAIRTFSALLPERFDDPDFRGRFAGIVGDDVRRIEGAVDRLARFAGLGAPERKPVDVSALLDELLEARREEIRDRRLVVLRELDREQGSALGDAAQLRFAFEALLGKALELVPDRGDVYVASRHHLDSMHGRPGIRVLLRFQSPDEVVPTVDVEGLSLVETALELVLADAIVRSQGGEMTASTADTRETVILIDLPA